MATDRETDPELVPQASSLSPPTSCPCLSADLDPCLPDFKFRSPLQAQGSRTAADAAPASSLTSASPTAKVDKAGTAPLMGNGGSALGGSLCTGKPGLLTMSNLSSASSFGTTNPSFGTTNPSFGTTTPSFGTTTPSFGTTNPSFGTTNPSFGTTTPSFGTTNPSFGTTNPSFGTTNPSFGTTNPSFGTTTSSFTTISPSFGTTTSSFGTTTPSFGTTNPSFGTTTSSFGTTTPSFGTTTPSFGTTNPSFGTTNPSFGTTTPSFGTTNPSFGTTTPSFGTTNPSFGTTNPSFGTTTPSFGTTNPSFGTTTPSFGTTNPSFGTTNPSFGTTNPSFGTTNPSFGTTNPSFGTTTPSFGTTNPSFGTTNPSFGTTTPSFGTTNPSFGTTTPSFGTTNPSFGTTTPSFGTTSPSFGTTTSSFGTTNPSFGTTTPSFGTTTPSFGTTTSSFGTTNPSFGTTNPSFGTTNRSFGTTTPSFGTTSPSFGTTTSSFGTTTPSFGTTNPSFGTTTPSFGTTNPSFGTTNPSFSTTNPSFGTTNPSFGTTNPSFGTTNPSFSTSSASFSTGTPSFSTSTLSLGTTIPSFSTGPPSSSTSVLSFSTNTPSFSTSTLSVGISTLTCSAGIPSFSTGTPSFSTGTPSFSTGTTSFSTGTPSFRPTAPAFSANFSKQGTSFASPGAAASGSSQAPAMLFGAAKELKTGSVMDVLGKTSNPASGPQPSKELKQGSVNDILGGNTAATKTDSLFAKFAKPAGSWECKECFVQNKADSAACAACSTPKPGARAAPAATSVPAATDSLLAKFAKPPGTWECQACLVQNKSQEARCLACSTPRPGATPSSSLASTPASSLASTSASSRNGASSSSEGTGANLTALFKRPAGDWDCKVCDVFNKSDSIKCVCCSSPRPGTEPSIGLAKTIPTSSFTFGSQTKSGGVTLKAGGGFSFNSTSTASSTASSVFFQSGSSDSKEGKSGGTGPTGGFQFGASEQSKTFGFGSATGSEKTVAQSTAVGGFKFDVRQPVTPRLPSGTSGLTFQQPKTSGLIFSPVASSSDGSVGPSSDSKSKQKTSSTAPSVLGSAGKAPAASVPCSFGTKPPEYSTKASTGASPAQRLIFGQKLLDSLAPPVSAAPSPPFGAFGLGKKVPDSTPFISSPSPALAGGLFGQKLTDRQPPSSASPSMPAESEFSLGQKSTDAPPPPYTASAAFGGFSIGSAGVANTSVSQSVTSPLSSSGSGFALASSTGTVSKSAENAAGEDKPAAFSFATADSHQPSMAAVTAGLAKTVPTSSLTFGSQTKSSGVTSNAGGGFSFNSTSTASSTASSVFFQSGSSDSKDGKSGNTGSTGDFGFGSSKQSKPVGSGLASGSAKTLPDSTAAGGLNSGVSQSVTPRLPSGTSGLTFQQPKTSGLIFSPVASSSDGSVGPSSDSKSKQKTSSTAPSVLGSAGKAPAASVPCSFGTKPPEYSTMASTGASPAQRLTFGQKLLDLLAPLVSAAPSPPFSAFGLGKKVPDSTPFISSPSPALAGGLFGQKLTDRQPPSSASLSLPAESEFSLGQKSTDAPPPPYTASAAFGGFSFGSAGVANTSVSQSVTSPLSSSGSGFALASSAGTVSKSAENAAGEDKPAAFSFATAGSQQPSMAAVTVGLAKTVPTSSLTFGSQTKSGEVTLNAGGGFSFNSTSTASSTASSVFFQSGSSDSKEGRCGNTGSTGGFGFGSLKQSKPVGTDLASGSAKTLPESTAAGGLKFDSSQSVTPRLPSGTSGPTIQQRKTSGLIFSPVASSSDGSVGPSSDSKSKQKTSPTAPSVLGSAGKAPAASVPCSFGTKPPEFSTMASTGASPAQRLTFGQKPLDSLPPPVSAAPSPPFRAIGLGKKVPDSRPFISSPSPALAGGLFGQKLTDSQPPSSASLSLPAESEFSLGQKSTDAPPPPYTASAAFGGYSFGSAGVANTSVSQSVTSPLSSSGSGFALASSAGTVSKSAENAAGEDKPAAFSFATAGSQQPSMAAVTVGLAKTIPTSSLTFGSQTKSGGVTLNAGGGFSFNSTSTASSTASSVFFQSGSSDSKEGKSGNTGSTGGFGFGALKQSETLDTGLASGSAKTVPESTAAGGLKFDSSQSVTPRLPSGTSGPTIQQRKTSGLIFSPVASSSVGSVGPSSDSKSKQKTSSTAPFVLGSAGKAPAASVPCSFGTKPPEFSTMASTGASPAQRLTFGQKPLDSLAPPVSAAPSPPFGAFGLGKKVPDSRSFVSSPSPALAGSLFGQKLTDRQPPSSASPSMPAESESSLGQKSTTPPPPYTANAAFGGYSFGSAGVANTSVSQSVTSPLSSSGSGFALASSAGTVSKSAENAAGEDKPAAFSFAPAGSQQPSMAAVTVGLAKTVPTSSLTFGSQTKSSGVTLNAGGGFSFNSTSTASSTASSVFFQSGSSDSKEGKSGNTGSTGGFGFGALKQSKPVGTGLASGSAKTVPDSTAAGALKFGASQSVTPRLPSGTSGPTIQQPKTSGLIFSPVASSSDGSVGPSSDSKSKQKTSSTAPSVLGSAGKAPAASVPCSFGTKPPEYSTMASTGASPAQRLTFGQKPLDSLPPPVSAAPSPPFRAFGLGKKVPDSRPFISSPSPALAGGLFGQKLTDSQPPSSASLSLPAESEFSLGQKSTDAPPPPYTASAGFGGFSFGSAGVANTSVSQSVTSPVSSSGSGFALASSAGTVSKSAENAAGEDKPAAFSFATAGSHQPSMAAVTGIAMTAGGSDLMAELSETVLYCEVCLEDFDDKIHIPRVLSCYHALCGVCLERLHQGGSLSCPKCRRETPVQGVFPVDMTRMAILDLKRSVQSQRGVSCEGCGGGAMVTSRCRDCAEFLCEDCSAAHCRLEVYRDHRVVSLSEAAKSAVEFLQASEKCDRHIDKKLELFCVTCSKAVCAICALTIHKKCKKLVELDSILDDEKKKMLSPCGQLAQVQQSFQKKAEESEASLEAVDSNLNTAMDQVKKVTSEIISSAIERETEVLEDLRAKAKSDRRLLKKQAATFRSLQAAARPAADYDRRCVTVSSASQVFSQIPELKETVAELREKAATRVKSAPPYKVATEKLPELKSLLKEIGRIESTAAPTGVQGLPVTLPSFQLDASRCGSGCWVGADLCSLSNQPSSHSHSQPQPQMFRFPGTCGTVAVSGGRSYWQVRCLITPKPQIRGGSWLCEVGVASLPALQAYTGGLISNSDHCALTAWVYTDSGQVKACAWYRNRGLPVRTLAPSTPHGLVDLTLGLLLDTDASRLHVIDVSATRVLWSNDIDLSTPVWPVVRVHTENNVGASVHVEVQSGQQISLTGNMVRLLQSVLGRDSQ